MDAETMDTRVTARWGWKLSLTWWIMKYGTIFAASVATSFAITFYVTQLGSWGYAKGIELYDQTLSLLPKREVVMFVSPEKVPTEKLLDMVSAEMKFDPAILRAIAMQESGGYTATNRVRDEPQLLTRGLIKPPANLNNIEKLLWASSHGILQIIFGFHYKECSLPPNGWDQLHDPLTNIRCGATILRNNARKYATIKSSGDRLWHALRDYNNSDEYADKVMRRIIQLKTIDYGEGI